MSRALWTLAQEDAGERPHFTDLVPPSDDPPTRHPGALLYFSESDAYRAAEYQNDQYGLRCFPVKLSAVRR